jgi:hypothetical protein
LKSKIAALQQEKLIHAALDAIQNFGGQLDEATVVNAGQNLVDVHRLSFRFRAGSHFPKHGILQHGRVFPLRRKPSTSTLSPGCRTSRCNV